MKNYALPTFYFNVNKIYSRLFVTLFSLFILVSCEPNTIEKQVEELVSETEKKDITQIAYSLADSIDTKASRLLIAKYPMQSSVKEKIWWGLQGMISRYANIEHVHHIAIVIMGGGYIH